MAAAATFKACIDTQQLWVLLSSYVRLWKLIVAAHHAGEDMRKMAKHFQFASFHSVKYNQEMEVGGTEEVEMRFGSPRKCLVRMVNRNPHLAEKRKNAG